LFSGISRAAACQNRSAIIRRRRRELEVALPAGFLCQTKNRAIPALYAFFPKNYSYISTAGKDQLA
jgi:hypothetical protein